MEKPSREVILNLNCEFIIVQINGMQKQLYGSKQDVD